MRTPLCAHIFHVWNSIDRSTSLPSADFFDLALRTLDRGESRANRTLARAKQNMTGAGLRTALLAFLIDIVLATMRFHTAICAYHTRRLFLGCVS